MPKYDQDTRVATDTLPEELVERVRRSIGIERETRAFNEEAGKDQIRHYAEGVGDDNPLWIDEEYASKTRWGKIIAPPAFASTCATGAIWRIQRPATGTIQALRPLYCGEDWEFFLPLYAGDKMKGTYKVVDVFYKHGSSGGRNIFLIDEVAIRNQHGNIVSKFKQIWIRSEGGQRFGSNKYADYKKPWYSEEDIEKIQHDYETQELRGVVPRYWEDVAVGDKLTHVVKGPLTMTTEVCWGAAHGGPYNMTHQIAHKFMRRHPRAATRHSDTNIPDFGERFHWVDSIAQDMGFPAAFDIGYERTGWFAQVCTNWMGDDGFLTRLVMNARRLNFMGDTTWCRGEVTDKYVKDGKHLVKVSLWAVNQRGETHTDGWAEMELPTKS